MANEVTPNLSTFQPKHLQLFHWINDPNIRNILAAGGIRSGKTIALIVAMFFRAIAAPGSTHCFFHAYRNVCKRNLFDQSFPEALEIILPGYWAALKADKQNLINMSDMTVKLPNGSRFLFLGLDDPEKVRGLKCTTILINEANQVDYKTISTLRGRLSESFPTYDPQTGLFGPPLANKMLFDLNPTTKNSWDHKVFVEGVIPGDETPLPNFKTNFRYLTINAIDNKANLPESVFEDFLGSPEEQRRRDEHGMWSEDNPYALFNLSRIKRTPVDFVTLVEIVVAVDPAGTANAKSDMTGIIVVGRDADGGLHVLEDATMKGSPDQWIAKAVELQQKYDANWIITERNYGRDILEQLMQRLAPSAPLKFVDAMGRGKRLRAEPVSAMYEQGRVSHAGNFRDLEMQMIEFDSPNFRGSPDRVDALVYGLLHLSGATIAPSKVQTGTARGFWSR